MNSQIVPQVKEKSTLFFWTMVMGIILLLTLSTLAAILFGSADLSCTTVWQVLKFKFFGIKDPNLQKSAIYIVWELRLPRAIAAIVVGGGLAISGATMQAVTQNILADPYILGISSGASAMVSLAYFLGGALVGSTIGVPLFAFLGAVIALVFVYAIGMSGSSASNSRLVLAGMAVSVILNAVSQFFISITPQKNAIRGIMAWMMGSLASSRWDNLAIPFFGSIIGSLVFIFTARAFNLLSLGDETAISLGVNVKRIKKMTTVIVALITGLIVATAGIIGFVGFIIPHIVRFLIGSDHRKLFPVAYLTGGLFLLWMDILARTVLAPQEIPIGIFTALCGGPLFIWLLYHKNKGAKI